jgi:butyrate kinase
MMSSNDKKTYLNLAEKVRVIERRRFGESSRKLAVVFNVERTLIQDIVKHKAEILQQWESSFSNAQRRRAKRRNKLYEEIHGNIRQDSFYDVGARNFPGTGNTNQVRCST